MKASISRKTFTDSMGSSQPRKFSEPMPSSVSLPSLSDMPLVDPGDTSPDDRTPLLRSSRQSTVHFSQAATPGPSLSRKSTTASLRASGRHHSRAQLWTKRLASALSMEALLERNATSDESGPADDRVWYDSFTSIDWIHDYIAESYRIRQLRARKDWWGRIQAFFDGGIGWLLSFVVGIFTAFFAFCIAVSHEGLFDLKSGYCAGQLFQTQKACCPQEGTCAAWTQWSDIVQIPAISAGTIQFVAHLTWVLVFSGIACSLTLLTKTTIASTHSLCTLDENLGATSSHVELSAASAQISPKGSPVAGHDPDASPLVYYPASGSGVAEVKVILSGFVIHKFLGVRTLFAKVFSLIFGVAAGLAIGSEGPLVSVAACVGNIACRLFPKYDNNAAKRREVLSAAAAGGVAVAFGAPIGGVLFSLEEASYFFPAKTLFRTFFCCITAALTLKFLDPYGTGKIVMFEVRYLKDWEWFEIVPYIGLGILGGAAGAMFIKASRIWAQCFRQFRFVKSSPFGEVLAVACLTGVVSYWNIFINRPVAEVLLDLASSCAGRDDDDLGLCPKSQDDIWHIVQQLSWVFVVKGVLTVITFGIKTSGGIYVPSCLLGGLLGRIVAHLLQLSILTFPEAAIFASCHGAKSGMSCITPGVYALLTGGAFMCGVTRLSITLPVILFELTGSLDYVLPFSVAVLVAKWTADAIEPLSIYDMLIQMNSYPFLDNRNKPDFIGDLGGVVSDARTDRIIDVTATSLVSAKRLRRMLRKLQRAGELDGGLPILRSGILVGLLPAPDLEYALDNLPNEEEALCLMSAVPSYEDEDVTNPADFTPFIDPAPIALDVSSPIDLAYECFAKLGLRYICVLRFGRYAGMVHRKGFVQYMRELE